MKRHDIVKEVNVVIAKNKLRSTPIDLNLVCKKNNIGIINTDLSFFGKELQRSVSGVITNLYGDRTIYIHNKDDSARQRFAIAHGLGHFFLHSKNTSDKWTYICCRGESNPIETEANNFAAELLMPEGMFRREVMRLITRQKLSLNHHYTLIVCRLADIFCVPHRAAEIRLRDSIERLFE